MGARAFAARRAARARRARRQLAHPSETQSDGGCVIKINAGAL
jgi:hypothetical protein